MNRVELCARLTGVPLIDYGRPTEGVLVGSGSGLMMALMDVCPNFRWCTEFDNAQNANWIDFIEGVSRHVLVVVAGWFSITDPRALREAVGRGHGVITYAGCSTPLGGLQCRTLAELQWLLGAI